MKTISKALEEVWEMKEKAYFETKDKSFEELKIIYKKSLEDAAKSLNVKLIRLPDGSYKLGINVCFSKLINPDSIFLNLFIP